MYPGNRCAFTIFIDIIYGKWGHEVFSLSIMGGGLSKNN